MKAKRQWQVYLLLAGAMCFAASSSRAAILADDFDDLGAASRFSSPFFSAETGAIDGTVDYAFDYGGLGIPSAPGSTGGSTIGLGIKVNNTDDPGDEGEAVGVSPLIANLPANYIVNVEAFIYYPGGTGASEHAVLGVNGDGTAVPFTFKTAGAGQFYHVPHDSGTTSPAFADDYYRVADGSIVELYNNNPNDAIADPETLGIFPAGSEEVDPKFDDAGFPGNQWMKLQLIKTGSMLELKVDGVSIDTYDIGAGASTGDIVLAGADIYNSANANNLIIFDNLSVVPEPASWLVLVMGAGIAGICRHRR